MKKKLQYLQGLSQKVAAKTAAAGGLSMLGIAAAHAELTPEAQAAFDGVSSTGTDMAGAAWPVVAGIVGSLIAIGLFKKFINKAT